MGYANFSKMSGMSLKLTPSELNKSVSQKYIFNDTGKTLDGLDDGAIKQSPRAQSVVD